MTTLNNSFEAAARKVCRYLIVIRSRKSQVQAMQWPNEKGQKRNNSRQYNTPGEPGRRIVSSSRSASDTRVILSKLR